MNRIQNFNYLQQFIRSVILLELSLVEHHDPVVVHDGVEPVGDGEDRAVRELPPDGGLHQVVRLKVHSRRGLVQYQNLEGNRDNLQINANHLHTRVGFVDLQN